MKWVRRLGRNRSLRYQLRLSFILISLIALILSALLTYFGVLGILEKKTNESSMQYFLQAGDSINEFREEIDKMTKQLLIDPKFQQFLDNNLTEIPSRIQLHREIMQEMDVYLRNYDYLDSIYLYADDGRAIGVNGQKSALINDSLKQGHFYSSNSYHQVLLSNMKHTFPSIVWSGANRSEDFGEPSQPVAGRDSARNIITAARSVKSLYQSLPSAILILNVKEEKLFTLYNNLKSKLNGQIYICNRSGQVISHVDKQMLGSESKACRQIPDGSESGSLKKQDEQIVYSQIELTDWMMVKEVPIHEFIGDILNLRYQMFWIVGVSFIAAFIASALWIKKVTRPMHNLMEAMGMVEKGKLEIILEDGGMNEFSRLSSGFNRMSVGIKQLIEQNRLAEKEKTKAEIQMLQAQINPHFLFNTLNTIKWMSVVNKSDNITKSITSLSNLLRPIFKNTALLCTLKEELEYADHYITILNYRYGEGVEIEYSVAPELMNDKVPRFVLQPLIENSVLHGFERSGYAGKIRIEAQECRPYLIVRVIDNGQGMSDEKQIRVRQWMESDHMDDQAETSDEAAYGIGLRNVYRRIRLNFPECPTLTISSPSSGGLCVEFAIPISDT